MRISKTTFEGLFELEIETFSDERGWFGRAFCKAELAAIGYDEEIVQINHSFNAARGTLRGMHCQNPPHSETKFVRCVAGKVFDVTVDIRRDSSTFLQWYGCELSATNKRTLLIPRGFAHGFLTLESNSQLIYLHSNYYNPEVEDGLSYADPSLKISWPTPIEVISPKDENHTFINSNFKGI